MKLTTSIIKVCFEKTVLLISLIDGTKLKNILSCSSEDVKTAKSISSQTKE